MEEEEEKAALAKKKEAEKGKIPMNAKAGNQVLPHKLEEEKKEEEEEEMTFEKALAIV